MSERSGLVQSGVCRRCDTEFGAFVARLLQVL